MPPSEKMVQLSLLAPGGAQVAPQQYTWPLTIRPSGFDPSSELMHTVM